MIRLDQEEFKFKSKLGDGSLINIGAIPSVSLPSQVCLLMGYSYNYISKNNDLKMSL